MKILITGHTSGLGKYLYETYSEQGHQVDGVSRTSYMSGAKGLTISKSEDRKKIVDSLVNYDLFINNAHEGPHQCYLLAEAEAAEHSATIVSIGSMAGDYVRLQTRTFYPIMKQALEETHDQLYLITKKRLIFIKPGYMENKTDKELFQLISFNEIFQAINFALSSPRVSKIELNNKLC